MNSVGVQRPWRSEEAAGSPGAGVSGGCHSHVSAGNQAPVFYKDGQRSYPLRQLSSPKFTSFFSNFFLLSLLICLTRGLHLSN